MRKVQAEAEQSGPNCLPYRGTKLIVLTDGCDTWVRFLAAVAAEGAAYGLQLHWGKLQQMNVRCEASLQCPGCCKRPNCSNHCSSSSLNPWAMNRDEQRARLGPAGHGSPRRWALPAGRRAALRSRRKLRCHRPSTAPAFAARRPRCCTAGMSGGRLGLQATV